MDYLALFSNTSPQTPNHFRPALSILPRPMETSDGHIFGSSGILSQSVLSSLDFRRIRAYQLIVSFFSKDQIELLFRLRMCIIADYAAVVQGLERLEYPLLATPAK